MENANISAITTNGFLGLLSPFREAMENSITVHFFFSMNLAVLSAHTLGQEQRRVSITLPPHVKIFQERPGGTRLGARIATAGLIRPMEDNMSVPFGQKDTATVRLAKMAV